jgi:hypothetical protein
MAKTADLASLLGWVAVVSAFVPSSSAWGDSAPDGGASAGTVSDAPEPKPVRFEEHYPRASAFPLREWLRRRGLRGPVSERVCWELSGVVGDPPADGVLCLKEDPRKSLRWARVYRAEAGRARLVFEAIVATWANWLELTPVLASDGTLLLHDRTAKDCYYAIVEYREKLDAQVPPPGGEWLEDACERVGKYRYEGGRYRLKEAHARLPTFRGRWGRMIDPP